ncbi:MAG: DUF2235 domain-containing protein [Leptolyngbyaceae cyanobacterium bins.349]|nr:DUF2235 domain-containing protein [Leptolyngbyaceae cyanobacterium bins.349]
MKRLIVCCDGTWQDLDGNYPTNVVKIAQAIKTIAHDGVPQILYYSEGIGTRSSRLDKMFGGAFGWGIDRRIQNAYRFLCCNYEEGDEIYLFGFSRGAYTARSLAGLIYKCGLLKRCHIRKTRNAYELYRNQTISPAQEAAVKFRQQYAVHLPTDAPGTQIPMTLLGCWDTVGSLGVPNTFPLSRLINRKYRFYDTRLNPKVQHALHAVAIDESRSVFNVTHMRGHEDRQNQVSEVWFTGTHGCVGGGREKNRGLSDITLQWMMNRMKELGLGLEFVENLNEVVEGGLQPDPYLPFDRETGLFDWLGTTTRSLVDQKDEDYDKLKTQDVSFLTQFFEQSISGSVKARWRSAALNPHYRPQPMLILKKWFDEMLH